MEIKKAGNYLRALNVSEWFDGQELCIKDFTVIENLLINDLIRDYFNKELDIEERVKAGFKIAIIAIVDKDGKSVFEESDLSQMMNGSYIPINRMIDMIFNPEKIDESFKKK